MSRSNLRLSRRSLLGAASTALLPQLLLAQVGCGSGVVVVHLVRHAEKQAYPLVVDAPRDPPLSERGQARALGLLRVLGSVPLAAVFSTPYKRTRDTVRPVAEQRGLVVQEVDANDTARLVQRVRAFVGREVLVSGHSNTVPEIARALGVPEVFELDDSAYGDLFVVAAGPESASLTRSRFES